MLPGFSYYLTLLFQMCLVSNILPRLYVLVMSCTRFRVNPHSLVAWMSRKSLLEAGAKSKVEVTATRLEPKMNIQPFGQTGQITELCSEYLSVRCIWLYVLVMSHMCFRVNPLYSCLNVKELLTWSRHKIWSLSDCN